MAEQKIVGYDYTMPYADGTDNVTTALMNLLNSYPGLDENDEITFSTLEVNSGKAMFPVSSVWYWVKRNQSQDTLGRIVHIHLY